ncbi:MAG TPA: hypothetical protein VFI74_03880 [Candidatus Saccharimonadales bacterium]|nr:hypothetical protein [Candidatus Saccharimonadales bacterium]
MIATSEIPRTTITMHQVGSFPAATVEEGLQRTLNRQTRTVLDSATDCETGSRANWVVDLIDSYRRNPAFELVEDGDWSGYDHCPRFKVAEGHTLVPDDFALPYHQFALDSWPAFDAARQRIGRPDLLMQVGSPSGLDLSLFTLGEQQGFDEEHVDAATQAVADQITAVHNEPFGDQVVYQLETPASLSLALAVEDPAFRQGLSSRLLDLVSRCPEGAQFGIHLCVGDLGNEARMQPPNRKASVELMNAIGSDPRWEGRKLRYIHEPIAAGHDVPTLESSMYEDLQDLRLPPGVRYIAGMLHERQSLRRQRKVLELVKENLPQGQALGIAAACGLGRRSRNAAKRIRNRGVLLAS